MRRRLRAAGVVALGALLLLAPGCGYRLTGTTIPGWLKELKVIAVLPFENRTNRPEIEQRVTEEVSSQLSRRKAYRVSTDPGASDAVLAGAITSYQTSAVEFTAEGRASRVEAVVVIQAYMRNVSTDEVLWSQSGLIFREQFDVPPEGEFFDEESLALDDIAVGAAGVVVTSIFEGF